MPTDDACRIVNNRLYECSSRDHCRDLTPCTGACSDNEPSDRCLERWNAFVNAQHLLPTCTARVQDPAVLRGLLALPAGDAIEVIHSGKDKLLYVATTRTDLLVGIVVLTVEHSTGWEGIDASIKAAASASPTSWHQTEIVALLTDVSCDQVRMIRTPPPVRILDKSE